MNLQDSTDFQEDQDFWRGSPTHRHATRSSDSRAPSEQYTRNIGCWSKPSCSTSKSWSGCVPSLTWSRRGLPFGLSSLSASRKAAYTSPIVNTQTIRSNQLQNHRSTILDNVGLSVLRSLSRSTTSGSLNPAECTGTSPFECRHPSFSTENRT